MAVKFVPIATSDAVGADIAASLGTFARRPYPRVLKLAAMSGGAAVGDSKAGIYIEDTLVAEIINTRLLLAPNKDDDQFIGYPLPANALLHVAMIDAMNTNAGTLKLETVP